jgi:hypothetical protein
MEGVEDVEGWYFMVECKVWRDGVILGVEGCYFNDLLFYCKTIESILILNPITNFSITKRGMRKNTKYLL